MQIHIHTEPNPEDNAMLQALYSRSPKSVTEHLEKLSKVGSGKFMEQFYLGYGHASIADCGFVTLYFEGISMLAAKAIEDNPLFNGQECSSRYIDFSNQEFIIPFAMGSEERISAAHAATSLRTFYVNNLEPTKEHLKTRFPKEETMSDAVYEKTIAAKAFDILRGFLPAGATTNVSWTTSLRKAHDKLVSLMHHPLYELRELARTTYIGLYEKYPHSFKKEYVDAASISAWQPALLALEGETVFKYRSLLTQFYSPHSFSGANVWLQPNIPAPLSERIGDDVDLETKFYHGIEFRPRKEPIPRHEAEAHRLVDFYLQLDYGSYRDLQRHRGGYCSSPVLDLRQGFHSWYYENLSKESQHQAKLLFADLSSCSNQIFSVLNKDASVETVQDLKLKLQYVTPMGTLVPISLRYPIHETVYVSELRSGKTVHSTLRPVAQGMARYLHSIGVPVDADMDESDWTIRRGTQDITSK